MPVFQALLDVFTSFIPGPRLIDGGDCLQLAKTVCSTANSITAHAGGGQANAVPLTTTYNEVDTVASANDSVQLPPAIPGQSIYIINAGAQSLQVFGTPSNPNNGGAGDTIAAHNSVNQTVTATGVAQASAAVGQYVCTTLGQWKQMLYT